MRMWMVNPECMCRKHLMGEHVEIHMIVGHMKRKKSVKGFLQKNCLEPKSLSQRHAQLVQEMTRRGYDHKSDLVIPENILEYLTEEERKVKVDFVSSKEDLMTRCSDCRERYSND